MTFSALPDPELDPQFYETVLTKRLLAGLFDWLVVLLTVFFIVLFTLGLGLFILFPLVFGISFAYRSFFIAKFSATLGMRLVGIELRSRAGHKFSTEDAMAHSGLYLGMALFFPIQLVNLACMALTDRGQGLHDLLMGSTAINRPA